MMRMLVMLPIVLLAACGRAPQQEEKQAPPVGAALLELAFNGVSRMPLDPHIRNRASAQADLVEAALELQQPGLAADFAKDIPNWRQAVAYADIATFHAVADRRADAEDFLGRAERMLDLAAEAQSGQLFATGETQELLESMQEWRLDRVKAHAAKTHMALGNHEKAEALRSSIGVEEAAAALAFEAEISTPETVGAIYAVLLAMAETKQFESVKCAIGGFAALYDRHYDDAETRKMVREAIDLHRASIPRFLQVETLLALARSAHGHGDADSCRNIVKEAGLVLEEASYFPRMYFPMKSQIVVLMHHAGESDAASEALTSLLERYEADRAEIVDIHRAAMVCRLAEAASVVNDAETAVRLYVKATEEGRVNPNSRPQADDLSEICRSIARQGITPSPDLLARLETMNNELGDPW